MAIEADHHADPAVGRVEHLKAVVAGGVVVLLVKLMGLGDMYHLLPPDQCTVAADEQRGVEAAAVLAEIEIGRGHDVMGAARLLKLPHDGVVLGQELAAYTQLFVLGEEAVQLQFGIQDEVCAPGCGFLQRGKSL